MDRYSLELQSVFEDNHKKLKCKKRFRSEKSIKNLKGILYTYVFQTFPVYIKYKMNLVNYLFISK